MNLEKGEPVEIKSALKGKDIYKAVENNILKFRIDVITTGMVSEDNWAILPGAFDTSLDKEHRILGKDRPVFMSAIGAVSGYPVGRAMEAKRSDQRHKQTYSFAEIETEIERDYFFQGGGFYCDLKFLIFPRPSTTEMWRKEKSLSDTATELELFHDWLDEQKDSEDYPEFSIAYKLINKFEFSSELTLVTEAELMDFTLIHSSENS